MEIVHFNDGKDSVGLDRRHHPVTSEGWKESVTWFIKTLKPGKTMTLHLVLKTAECIPNNYVFKNIAYYQDGGGKGPITGKSQHSANTTFTKPAIDYP